MHSLIRAVVFAKNEEEGLAKARSIFEELVESGKFDYYTDFAEEGTTVSGQARWGEYPVIALADSPEGKKLIEDGFKSTKDEFFENLKHIRTGIEKYTDEELWKGEDNINGIKGFFHYYCNQLGQYDGNTVWLYDNDGEGIKNERHLNDVLSKWQNANISGVEEYKDLNVYVVPADVHF